MIVEVADFRVSPDQHAVFGEVLTRGMATVLSKAKGYRAHRILGCIETPGRYLLTIEWETLEDHTEGFRHSPAFGEWRAIIGPYFVQPPQVEHFRVVDAQDPA
ncbi:antibiotic biosynthesis monooxygenase family protein [Pseudorhodoferax sp.]|uniref:antibiotic biosynthesis monooxygenase family protein n=1 Tax=Pseudorhodoferax sp. TaxID=1993553 RepID=UPI0039E3C5F8